jgi:ubiquitin fusion degradation protein 1
VGDTIPINYNNRRYFIDIVEAKPANAISVIETDCNVGCLAVQATVSPA